MSDYYHTEQLARTLVDHAQTVTPATWQAWLDHIEATSADLPLQVTAFEGKEEQEAFVAGATRAYRRVRREIQQAEARGAMTPDDILSHRLHRAHTAALKQHKFLRGMKEHRVRSAYYQGLKDVYRVSEAQLQGFVGDAKHRKTILDLLEESYYDHYERHQPMPPRPPVRGYTDTTPIILSARASEVVARSRSSYNEADTIEARQTYPEYAALLDDVIQPTILAFRRAHPNRTSAVVILSPRDTTDVLKRLDSSHRVIRHYFIADAMQGEPILGKATIAGIKMHGGMPVVLTPDLPVRDRYVMSIVVRRHFPMFQGKLDPDQPLLVLWCDYDPETMADGKAHLEASLHPITVHIVNERTQW